MDGLLIMVAFIAINKIIMVFILMYNHLRELFNSLQISLYHYNFNKFHF